MIRWARAKCNRVPGRAYFANQVKNVATGAGVLSQRALQIQVRLTQFQTFFTEGVFKGGPLSIKLEVETPHFEEISDAEKNLQVSERLEQEVGRTCAKSGASRFLIYIRCQ